MRMRSKQLGGSRVWTAGSGPTVVVVHGGPGFNHKYLTRSLLPLSPHFRLVFYDQRSRGAISPATLTEQLRRILVAAAVDGPPVVLAHSWGTYLAFACLTLPDSPAVRGAVLVSPVPLTLNGFNRAGARFNRLLPRPAPTGIRSCFRTTSRRAIAGTSPSRFHSSMPLPMERSSPVCSARRTTSERRHGSCRRARTWCSGDKTASRSRRTSREYPEGSRSPLLRVPLTSRSRSSRRSSGACSSRRSANPESQSHEDPHRRLGGRRNSFS